VLSRLLPDWTAEEMDAFAAQLRRFNNDVTTNRHAAVLAAIGSDAR
jgi:hypothetical protein